MSIILHSEQSRRRRAARFNLRRLSRLSLGLLLLVCMGCGGGSERVADAAVVVDASAAPGHDGGAPADPRDAGAEQLPDPDSDPTRPDPTTGVFEPPSAAFDAELAALLAYKREVPSDCPGLLAASSCGNGVCDGLTESAETCSADCVFHLAGAYNDLPICPSYQQRVKVSSQDEVQAAVRAAVHEGKRVRAVGAQHSASGAICGDGVVLDLSGFADVSATRVEGDVAYVQPGVTLFTLGEHLAERGLGIGLAHLGFRGVTVAGALGTAAHGSSPIHNHSVSHRLAALTLVLADGNVRSFRERETEPTLWRALQTHLGLLGVIVEVGLYVEPAFDLDVALNVIDESEILTGPGALALLEGCDFGQMNWFPHQHKALRWCGVKTTTAADGARVDNTLLDPGVTPDLAPLAKASFHAGTCDPALNATLENTRYQGLVDNPPLLITEQNGTRRAMNVEGPAYRLVSSDLIALGANKYFQMDWEVAVPEPYIQLALETARKVFDAHDVSLPGVGVFMRFGKIERGGWLSYHSSGRRFAEGQTAMFFETPVAVPAGYTQKQLEDYLHIYRELASLFIRHFGARAHWGKNSDALFAEQVKASTYQGRVEKMNEAVAQLDPYGVFANNFGRALGIRWPKQGESFARALGGDTCDCGTESEPVCAYRERQVYANRCRANCAGAASEDLLEGPCAAFDFAPCSLIDGRTCVWERKAREHNPLQEPVARY